MSVSLQLPASLQSDGTVWLTLVYEPWMEMMWLTWSQSIREPRVTVQLLSLPDLDTWKLCVETAASQDQSYLHYWISTGSTAAWPVGDFTQQEIKSCCVKSLGYQGLLLPLNLAFCIHIAKRTKIFLRTDARTYTYIHGKNWMPRLREKNYVVSKNLPW